ncbi:MAG: hypothetical protein ABW140_01890 [Candidatus Sedimenticola sp. 6PFRAG1]
MISLGLFGCSRKNRCHLSLSDIKTNNSVCRKCLDEEPYGLIFIYKHESQFKVEAVECFKDDHIQVSEFKFLEYKNGIGYVPYEVDYD